MSCIYQSTKFILTHLATVSVQMHRMAETLNICYSIARRYSNVHPVKRCKHDTPFETELCRKQETKTLVSMVGYWRSKSRERSRLSLSNFPSPSIFHYRPFLPSLYGAVSSRSTELPTSPIEIANNRLVWIIIQSTVVVRRYKRYHRPSIWWFINAMNFKWSLAYVAIAEINRIRFISWISRDLHFLRVSTRIALWRPFPRIFQYLRFINRAFQMHVNKITRNVHVCFSIPIS